MNKYIQKKYFLSEKELKKKYTDKDFYKNYIYGHNVYISYDKKKCGLNNNVCMFGNEEQLENYVIDNILQANSNYILFDKNFLIAKKTKQFLLNQGYNVFEISLCKNIAGTHWYNPLTFVHNESQLSEFILDAVSLLNINEKKAMATLLSDIAFVMLDNNLEISFENLRGLLPCDTEDYTYIIAILDKFFVNSLMEKSYRKWVITTSRDIVCRSIQYLVEMCDYFSGDKSYGKGLPIFLPQDINKKFAIFIFADDDKSSHLYTTMFHKQVIQELIVTGTNEIPTIISSVNEMPTTYHYMITCYRYNIHYWCMHKHIAEMKKCYQNDWDLIFSNCDIKIYFGGTEYGTVEYLSKEIGCLSIEDSLRLYSNRGKKTSSSMIIEPTQHNVLYPDRIMKLQDESKILILFRRGKPIITTLFNTREHKNYKYLNTAK